MDPASHRLPTSRLAKKTSGRVLSVRYRLAPQHPFPSAILDGLIAYLSLLSPPPGSFHSAVQASNIVLAGDSAGGNISLVLLQTLLTLRRKGVTSIRLHGTDVPLELPAGLALSSPWSDVSLSMPTCQTNAKYDYLSPPGEFRLTKDAPPEDDVWPTRPPRLHHYTSAATLVHPLVSPISIKPEHWKGSPPVYICVGTEALEDECTIVARRLHAGGAQVRLDGYEGMPHCFPLIFPTHILGKECFSSWSQFITDVVKRGGPDKDDPNQRWWGKVTWAKAFSNPISRHEVPWAELKSDLTDELVDKLLTEKKEGYMEKEEELLREWMEKEGQEQNPSPTQPSLENEETPRPKL
jgi:acetyl esterase/lipase